MGDRGNIVIREGKPQDDIWLYTHWSGSEIEETAKAAMKRCPDRWQDAPYLARNVFCEMVGTNTKDTTGFGIATHITDNEHPIVVLDTQAQEVFMVKESDLEDGRLPKKLADGIPFVAFTK